MNKGIWVAAGAAGVLAFASTASAQEAPRGNIFNRPVLAPSNALEISVNAGYAQGVGDISNAPGQRIQDIAGAGGAVGLDIGYRATPHLLVGVYGQGAMYNNQIGDTDVRDFTGGIQANLHFAPYVGMDPWIGLGTGFHGLWLAQPGPNANYLGWEIGRVRLGADFRVSNEVALGPQIGASANLYLSEKLPGDTSFHDVSNKRVNVAFFAGLQGRFDMAGMSVRPASNVAAR